MLGKHALAETVEQKRCLAVLTRAADRGDEVPEQPPGQFRGKDHGYASGRDLARIQAPQCACRRDFANSLRFQQSVGRTRCRVPVIALQRAVLACDNACAHRVTARGNNARKTVTVRVRGAACARCGRGALRVRDARVDRARGVFAIQGEFRRRLDIELPRVEQVEIGRIDRHELRIGESGKLVRRCEARNAHRLADGGFDARGREIPRARVALAAVSVDGYAKTAVLLPLDRFELAHAYGDAESLAITCRSLRLIGAEVRGDFHCASGTALEFAGYGVNVHVSLRPEVRRSFQRSRIAQ